MKQIKIFIYLIISVGVIISLYACVMHFFVGGERVAAPFDPGEANTLGGYLIIIIFLVTGLLLSSTRNRILLFSILGIMFPAFLFTLSRGAWLGFIFGYFTLFILTKKGRLVLFLILLLAIFFSKTIFPEYVIERIRTTFTPGKEYAFMGKRIILEESAAARIESWQYGFRYWVKEPIIGYGIGVGGTDNQYVRVLIESGMLGLGFFIWLLSTIFRVSLTAYIRLVKDEFSRGVILGFICAFVGLVMHAFTSETFQTIRIMEPFWFLAAIVIILPELGNASQIES